MKDLNFKVDEAFYYRYKYAALDRRMSLIGLMRVSVEEYLSKTEGEGRPEGQSSSNKKKRKK